jgi:hypothetical protein
MPGGRTAKRSGAAVGREPAGAKPLKRRCLVSLLTGSSIGSLGVVHRASTFVPLLRFKKVLRFRGKKSFGIIWLSG